MLKIRRIYKHFIIFSMVVWFVASGDVLGWESVLSPGNVEEFAVIKDIVFALTDSSKVFKSDNIGMSWTPIPINMETGELHAIDADLGKLYVACRNGVIVTEDLGGSFTWSFHWTWDNSRDVDFENGAGWVAVDMWGNRSGPNRKLPDGVWDLRRGNNLPWENLSTYEVVVDRLEPQKVAYIGAIGDYRTLDGGDNWLQCYYPVIFTTVIDGKSAAFSYNTYTTDHGGTWLPSGIDARAFVKDEDTGLIFAAASDGGVYIGAPKSWKFYGLSEKNFQALAVVNNYLLCASINGEIFRTDISTGKVTVDKFNPPTWSYTLTCESGSLTQWIYSGGLITGASVTGEAAEKGWEVSTQTTTLVVFSSKTPLTKDDNFSGFEISGENQGKGMWFAGVNSGNIDGPVKLSSFTVKLSRGINLISIPVQLEGWRMSDLAEHIGKDNVFMIIRYDYTQNKFISYLPTFPNDSPANALVQCGEGYIVVMKGEKEVVFKGNPCESKITAPSLAPLISSSDEQSTSIFVVTGNVRQEVTGRLLRGVYAEGRGARNDIALNGVAVRIRNMRTGQTVEDVTGTLAGYGNYIVTFVASSEEFMTRATDNLEITAMDKNRFMITSVTHTLTPRDISDYVLVMPLHLSLPKKSALLQNYPNPFNPETWLPYQLAQNANVTISIYNIKGKLVRTLLLGNQSAGVYIMKHKSAYWDGKDSLGDKVASGVYFYTLQAGDFSATRKMVVLK